MHPRLSSFDIFFTAVLNTAEKKFMEDLRVVKGLVSIATNAACEKGRESPGLGVMWNMLYADDAGIVSRSKDSLAKIMSVVVETCDAFGLTVS